VDDHRIVGVDSEDADLQQRAGSVGAKKHRQVILIQRHLGVPYRVEDVLIGCPVAPGGSAIRIKTS
jgi:hypothetical protein